MRLGRGVFDVVLVVDREWAHQDAEHVDVRPGRVRGDCEVTHAAGGEALAVDVRRVLMGSPIIFNKDNIEEAAG